MTEGKIQWGLAKLFDWQRQRCYTNTALDTGIADFVCVTPAGYLTEVEIKISAGDWNVDGQKPRWKAPLKHTFYFAVPFTLLGKCPSWVPADVGLISCQDTGTGVLCKIHREAKRVPRQVTTKMRQKFETSLYFRWWRK